MSPYRFRLLNSATKIVNNRDATIQIIFIFILPRIKKSTFGRLKKIEFYYRDKGEGCQRLLSFHRSKLSSHLSSNRYFIILIYLINAIWLQIYLEYAY